MAVSVFHKSRKALEILLFSLGLISSLAMLKTATSPSSIKGSWNSIKCLLSSHICISIIMNVTVLLIVASSHRPDKIDDGQEGDDHDCFPEPVKYQKPVATDLKEEVDTMEATWRSINGEGNPEPKKKHLEKCETWEKNVARSTPKWKELRKSETFNDSVSMIRRDPSTSLEEFNKQVEAFIKRFNDDMKLQRRQESDQRFLDI